MGRAARERNHSTGEHAGGRRKVMTSDLTKSEREILSALSEHGGLPTREVAKHVTYCAHSNRMRSAAVRTWLDRLKNHGLVDYLEDKVPHLHGHLPPHRSVYWVRTELGKKAVEAAEGEK